ncbi:Sporulation killing factor maturation protein SkfB [Acaryochloris thomasi RCC1774]|uniref:Sporulation killing factor maturation protein SkfB n=1 Tax=Acaryochloris thomasi RCC1774 TaxID=1764569 RepID=A0A2W1JA03_9CYAN|nr:radical SAM protein [Acaryochloris thomasi]PZD70848.1 Sporulation killing factor maturation protein SkfB [Acaryochloris thomasi RCC1774]
MNNRNEYTLYSPRYSLSERAKQTSSILRASSVVAYHLLRGSKEKFAASVEITDKCNAGCSFCYVYPSEWDQNERLGGYLQLSPSEHKLKEKNVYETLRRLKSRGVVHVTLVGGETALAPKAIRLASKLFPVVWVVTNGVVKLPRLPNSVTVFVSIDGPPDYHNKSRDPKGFYKNYSYNNLQGMSANIVRNINESERGAYVHITLSKPVIKKFSDTVDWLVKDVRKLRGIIVSGTATKDFEDPCTFSIEDRKDLKKLIESAAEKYGWKLFPFNQPKVNERLFDEKYIISNSSSCSVAQRVESLNYDGSNVGKCVLRDDTLCETCVCNISGLAQAINLVDIRTISGVLRATYG